MATTTMPQYRIQVRDNTLTPLGEITRPLDGDLVLNFNDVSQWVVTVRADSPMAPAFVKGNGIIISRDRGDGTGAQTILSGPIWHFERRLRDNVYVLAGPDDLWWLKARRADPVTNYPYQATVLSGAPLRYYRLGEASGTVAADLGSNAQNGTYTGGYTLNQPPGIDDSNPAVLFNGSTGYVSLPMTGLPSGATSCGMGLWVYPLARPGSGNVTFAWWGTVGTKQAIALKMDSTGGAFFSTQANDTAKTTIPLNTWTHLGCEYDNAALKLRCYVNGALASEVTTTALNIGTTAARIGQYNANEFANAILDEVAIYSGTPGSAGQFAAMYAVGVSRYAASAYDTRTNPASTVIRGYVNDNAGPGALASRRVFGLALAADPVLGSSVTGNARFDVLLALIQQLALSGGDIGFKLVQTDVGVLTFSIYQPATKSNAIFSRELGNLLDAVYTLDGPVANSYLAAGGGVGVARTVAQGSDSTSVSAWGLIEGFIDTRDTSDLPTMQQRIAAQLAQDAQQTNLSITPVDTPALTFGRDYGLGDIVSVQIDGATITDKIRQLHIQLNSNDQELITPGIGNAGAGQIAALFDAQQRALAAVQTQLARLQAAQ